MLNNFILVKDANLALEHACWSTLYAMKIEQCLENWDLWLVLYFILMDRVMIGSAYLNEKLFFATLDNKNLLIFIELWILFWDDDFFLW